MKAARIILAAAAGLTAALGIAGPVLSLLSHTHYAEGFFIADALYLQDLTLDIFIRHHPFADWHLTPAPYLFPDALLFLPLLAVTQDAYWMTIGYAAVQLLAVYGGVWLVARRALPKTAALAAVGSAAVGLSLFSLRPLSLYRVPMMSGLHFGAILSGLYVLAAAIAVMQAPRRPWFKIAVTGMLCLLTALSDRLFVGQIAVPLAVCIGLFAWRKRMEWRIAAALIGAILGGSALGVMAYPHLVPHIDNFPVRIGLNAMKANGIAWADFVWREASFTSIALLAVFGAWFAAAGALAWRGLWRQTGDSAAAAGLVGGFLWLSAITTTGLALAMQQPEFNGRYALALAFLPLLLGPVALARFVPVAWLERKWVAAVGGVLLAGLAGYAVQMRVAEGQEWRADYYPPDIACIDAAALKHDVKAGVSSYWQARPTAMFSKSGITVAPIDEKLEPFHWIVTDQVFRDAYDFVIIAPDDSKTPFEARLTALNGMPAATENCGDKRLLIYGRGTLHTK